jgi:hypothetical protein
MSKAARILVGVLLSSLGVLPISDASAQQVWRWSQTIGNNAVADPTVNWTIGMAPSAVSGSSRAMMAAVARYRDDISGAVTTSGTSTAFTAASNQGLCASPSTTPQDGQLFSFTPHATNGISPTLQVDSCSAFAIQTSPGTAVGAATLIQGTPYTAKFSNSASAWILRDYYGSAFNVPLGGLLSSTLATPPNSNFVLPAGQCLSTVTYNAYWVALGSPASGACPGGQFAIIDMRGRVPAALDNLNGTAAGRLTSSSTGCGTAMTSIGAVCANGSESHTLSVAEMPSHYHSAGIYDPGHTHGHNAQTGSTTTGGGGFPAGSNGGATINAAVTGVRVNSSNGIDTTNSTGGGGAHAIVQPTIGVVYFLRVL